MSQWIFRLVFDDLVVRFLCFLIVAQILQKLEEKKTTEKLTDSDASGIRGSICTVMEKNTRVSTTDLYSA